MGSILVADTIDETAIEILKQAGHTVDAHVDITPDQLQKKIASFDALIVRSRTRVTSDAIGNAAKLKVIARAGTGVDNIDVKAAQARGIVVVNAQGANAEAVAEHTLGLMLMLARNLLPVTRGLSEGKWMKKDFTAMELMGKTLGIVGFGHIGFRVAQLGRAFGMMVIVHSRTTETEDKKKQLQMIGGRFTSLEELLSLSDIVSIHTPLTPETTHLFGVQTFSNMKKTAYLINAARGEIVDEHALISALQAGSIAGAALDVYGQEPLRPDSPLLRAPNCILTPHIASVSREGAARISQMVADDVVRVLSGNSARHIVR